MTLNIKSECFISAWSCYASLKFVYDITTSKLLANFYLINRYSDSFANKVSCLVLTTIITMIEQKLS